MHEVKDKKELKKMSLEEVQSYYRNLRKYNYEHNLPIQGIEERKKKYKLNRVFLKADKIICHRIVKIIGDKRVKSDTPKIYACTHVGRYDIESAMEAINESAWFLMGDPGETYLNFNGKILEKLGTIFFDTDDKLDRHIALENCIKVLEQGGNVLMFPEGAWSLDSVYPVQKLFPGLAEMAIRTGAEIVPVAIEQYNNSFLKKYYVNIGKNMSFIGSDIKDKEEIADIVRWKLTDLKWEIWEKFEVVKRSEFSNNWRLAREKFIQSIMCDSENGYTIEEIERTRYHEKEKLDTPAEVFSYLSNLKCNTNTAFLAKAVLQYSQYEKEVESKTRK